MCCRLEPTWILAGMIDWTCHLVLDALSGGIPLWWPSVGARQLENAWIAGLHTDARWTGVIDGRTWRSTVAAGLDRPSERR
jgi:hypothetical protein